MEGPRDAVVSLWFPVLQCAWCGAVKLLRWYLPLPGVPILGEERTLQVSSLLAVGFSTTHGICNGCARRVGERARRNRVRRTAGKPRRDRSR
jgi:hypothetical protein